MDLMKDSFDWTSFTLIWVLFLILPTKDYIKSIQEREKARAENNYQESARSAWALHFYYACLCLIMIFATIFEFLLHVNIPALSQILGVS